MFAGGKSGLLLVVVNRSLGHEVLVRGRVFVATERETRVGCWVISVWGDERSEVRHLRCFDDPIRQDCCW